MDRQRPGQKVSPLLRPAAALPTTGEMPMGARNESISLLFPLY